MSAVSEPEKIADNSNRRTMAPNVIDSAVLILIAPTNLPPGSGHYESILWESGKIYMGLTKDSGPEYTDFCPGWFIPAITKEQKKQFTGVVDWAAIAAIKSAS